MHRFILHNDEIRDAGDSVLAPGQVGLMNGWGVFSTIRVYDGVLFAWERHWERMRRDAARMRVPFPEKAAWLEERLLRLIDANQAWNATLRAVVVRNRGGMFEGPGAREFDVLGFTRDVQLWAVFSDGTPVTALVTAVQLAGDERRCLLWLIGGSRARDWADGLLARVEPWARGLGCSALWGSGRRGWARLVEPRGFERIADLNGQPTWQRRIA